VEWKQSWPRFVEELSKTRKNLVNPVTVPRFERGGVKPVTVPRFERRGVKPVTVPRFETGGLPNAPTFDTNLVCACAMIFICQNNKVYNETV